MQSSVTQREGSHIHEPLGFVRRALAPEERVHEVSADYQVLQFPQLEGATGQRDQLVSFNIQRVQLSGITMWMKYRGK